MVFVFFWAQSCIDLLHLETPRVNDIPYLWLCCKMRIQYPITPQWHLGRHAQQAHYEAPLLHPPRLQHPQCVDC